MRKLVGSLLSGFFALGLASAAVAAEDAGTAAPSWETRNQE